MQQTGVEIREISGRVAMERYIRLPYRLHRNHPLWVPPLMFIERQFHDRRTNRQFEHSRTVYFMAFRDGDPIGRIMGIINERLFDHTDGDRHARFCQLEAIDDRDVIKALLGAVEDWARQHDMPRLVGPLGFSNQDPEGFLVEGFDQRPSIGTIYNGLEVPEHIESAGYEKEVDYVTYKVPIPEQVPPIFEKLHKRVQRNAEVVLREFTTKLGMARYLHRVLELMNETYQGIYGFVPLTSGEIRSMSRIYFQICHPRFLKVVETKDGEVVAFVLGIKDITEGFKKVNGYLFPFGYFFVKYHQARSRRLDLLLGAVKGEYRGRGLDLLMASAMIKSANELGTEYADSHHELESNELVQAEMRNFGGHIYKRHRVYQKTL